MTKPGDPNDLQEIDPLMMDYLLDHYRNPHNFGTIEDADVKHEEGNPSCGDRIEITAKVRDGIIVDIKFNGKGCIVSQSAASILTDLMKGEKLEKVREFSREDMLENMGIEIGPMRLKCALLALKVLKAGVYGQTDWPGEEDQEDE